MRGEERATFYDPGSGKRINEKLNIDLKFYRGRSSEKAIDRKEMRQINYQADKCQTALQFHGSSSVSSKPQWRESKLREESNPKDQTTHLQKRSRSQGTPRQPSTPRIVLSGHGARRQIWASPYEGKRSFWTVRSLMDGKRSPSTRPG